MRYLNAHNCFMTLVIGGGANGYVTARLMKFFGATDWTFSASAAAIWLPLKVTSVFFLVDMIEYFEKSEQLVPFTSIVLFSALYVLLNVPASYFGAYFAYNYTDDKPPLKISTIRRPIPAQPFYLNDKFIVLLGGLLMFTTVMAEFHYVIMSVWRS